MEMNFLFISNGNERALRVTANSLRALKNLFDFIFISMTFKGHLYFLGFPFHENCNLDKNNV